VQATGGGVATALQPATPTPDPPGGGAQAVQAAAPNAVIAAPAPRGGDLPMDVANLLLAGGLTTICLSGSMIWRLVRRTRLE
jgi:hypothetical protein